MSTSANQHISKSAYQHTVHKSISNSLSILLCIFLITACNLMVTDDKLIFGKWVGTEWISEGVPTGYDPQEASFTFEESGDYIFQYGGNIEKGKFTYSNKQLFTTPEDGIRMMVKVAKLTNETLIMDMNRGGQAERLTLIKQE